MNIADVRVAKAKILRCLTEDFTYGKTAKGAPLKRPKRNQALFNAQHGYAVWSKTDLEMVMDAVVLGLYFALDEPNEEQTRMRDALTRIAGQTHCYECEAEEIAFDALNPPATEQTVSENTKES